MTTDTKALAKKQEKISPIDALAIQIMGMMSKREARLELLLPRGADVQRFKESFRFALAQQPSLLKCTPESLVLALMRGARTGLPVDGGGGLAYIVPYGDQATYVPGYKGMITLAKATGLVRDMQPKAVHLADVFEVDEAEGRVTHRRFIPRSADDDRGPLIAVYCRTILPDGTVRYTVMDLVDIERKRAKSRAKNGPWSTDFEAMALKSVIKEDFKSLGVPPGDTYKALRVALASDFEAETGEREPELETLERATEPTANDRLKERLEMDRQKRIDDLVAVGHIETVAKIANGTEPDEAERAAIIAAEHEAARQ